MDISQLGASGAVVIVVAFFLKYMKEEAIKREETINKLGKAVDQNTSATKELVKTNREHYNFLKNLNGKLTKAVTDTAKENTNVSN
jgi:transcription elongation factor GreA-like protein